MQKLNYRNRNMHIIINFQLKIHASDHGLGSVRLENHIIYIIKVAEQIIHQWLSTDDIKWKT